MKSNVSIHVNYPYREIILVYLPRVHINKRLDEHTDLHKRQKT